MLVLDAPTEAERGRVGGRGAGVGGLGGRTSEAVGAGRHAPGPQPATPFDLKDEYMPLYEETPHVALIALDVVTRGAVPIVAPPVLSDDLGEAVNSPETGRSANISRRGAVPIVAPPVLSNDITEGGGSKISRRAGAGGEGRSRLGDGARGLVTAPWLEAGAGANDLTRSTAASW